MISQAYSLGAQRLELANVQYYGWAAQNRQLLMPSRRRTNWRNELSATLSKNIAARWK
jgi:pyrroloquinoline quinone biosynthesis protein E